MSEVLARSNSPRMQVFLRAIDQIAHSSVPVLLLGETGTGKEVLARRLHELSVRAAEPFVAVNCAAIPDNLLEAELFGHERGAFTGAHARRLGKFEAAAGGTMLLDEVADLPLPLQSKLLRVVQERQFEPLGGNRTVPLRARLLAATSLDLQQAVADGRFRADLYYRIAVVTVVVPPLRQRLDDLAGLSAALLRRHARREGAPVKELRPDLIGMLRRHQWPGNVRELDNVLVAAAVRTEGPLITRLRIPSLPVRQSDNLSTPGSMIPLPSRPDDIEPLAEYERRLIAAAMEAAGGNLSECARRLGIGRATLRRKLSQTGDPKP